MPCLSNLSLTTRRLALRPLEARDIDAWFAICSHPDVMRYGSSPPWTTPATALETLEKDRRAALAGDSARLGIFRQLDGQLLGTCSIFEIDEDSRRAEIGYLLAPSAWGQGYASETVSALLAHAFHDMGLNRVEADIDPQNTASARLLERLGFTKEGFLRERWIIDGRKSDSVIYGLLAAEFELAK